MSVRVCASLLARCEHQVFRELENDDQEPSDHGPVLFILRRHADERPREKTPMDSFYPAGSVLGIGTRAPLDVPANLARCKRSTRAATFRRCWFTETLAMRLPLAEFEWASSIRTTNLMANCSMFFCFVSFERRVSKTWRCAEN